MLLRRRAKEAHDRPTSHYSERREESHFLRQSLRPGAADLKRWAKMKILLVIVGIGIAVISLANITMLAILAFLGGLFSLLCFGGGPDGKVGSGDSISSGFLFLSIFVASISLAVVYFRTLIRAFDKSRTRFWSWVIRTAPLTLIGLGVLFIRLNLFSAFINLFFAIHQ